MHYIITLSAAISSLIWKWSYSECRPRLVPFRVNSRGEEKNAGSGDPAYITFPPPKNKNRRLKKNTSIADYEGLVRVIRYCQLIITSPSMLLAINQLNQFRFRHRANAQSAVRQNNCRCSSYAQGFSQV